MPRYHQPPENWKGRGRIKIVPRPFVRRLPFLKFVIPYHVGDRVKFLIQTQMPNKGDGIFSHVIYENFGGEVKTLSEFNSTNTEIVGNIINAEGNVEYLIGRASGPHNTETIFTARVESWDTIVSKWAWAIVGAILTLLCGILIWLLNFFQVVPVYKIWIQR